MYAALKVFGFLNLWAIFLFFSGRTLLFRISRPTLTSYWTAGILCVLTLNLIIPSLKLALIAQGILASAGVLTINKLPAAQRWKLLKLGMIILFTCFLFSLLILAEPIKDWDARSIWFYHAKVIRHMGDIWAHSQWNKQASIYSHLDYPKLFPLLAALTSIIFQLWNEFIPKLAITILLIPVLSFILEFRIRELSNARAKVIFITTLIILLLGFEGSGFFLTSGYMDGWLAIYAVCTTLSLVGALYCNRHNLPEDQHWLHAILFSGIASQLKQEGVAISLAIVIPTILIMLFRSYQKKSIHFTKPRIGNRSIVKKAFLIFYSLTPLLIWNFGVRRLHLQSSHYSGDLLQRMSDHWNTQGIPEWILANLVFHNPVVLPSLCLAFLILIVYIVRYQEPPELEIMIPLLSAAAYFSILFCVYLSTSADVIWHLSRSAGRATLVVGLLISGFNFLVLNELISPAPAKNPGQ